MWRYCLAAAIGYVFAVVVGHWVIRWIVDDLWKKMGWSPARYSERPEAYLPSLLGLLERTLYVASLQLGRPEFIGIWLAVKVAGQWKRWAEDAQIGERRLEGRVFYNTFLIGNGLSILYAGTASQLIDLLRGGYWATAACLAILLLAATYAFKKAGDCWKARETRQARDAGHGSDETSAQE